MNSNDRMTRRQLLGVTVTAAAGLAGASAMAAPATTAAAAFPHLDEKEAQAVALHYVHDAKLVDAKKNPAYKPGQHCANCMHLTGKDGDAWRPCNIFPKKLVASNGWCSVWAKKPGTA
ncbi:MAG: high-potential iron-sulfur protein [Steroidobacteraceae bacterium]